MNKLAKTLILSVVLVLVSMFVIVPKGTEQKPKEPSTHEKALVLGLFNATPEMEARHVFVSEHTPDQSRDGDTAVHIMFRPGSDSPWHLCGTGTRLGKFPNSILSAYHVFEGFSDQYGVRKIGPSEFTGSEKILPMVSCESAGQADDAVSCTIDTNRTDFPIISVPKSKNMFVEWETKGYEAKIWAAKVHFITYPEKEIQGVMWIEVKPGVYHYFFDWTPRHAESGTAAIVEGQKPGSYLVVIRGQFIPKDLYDQIPLDQRKVLNWSEGKEYGVGNLVVINPNRKQ